MLPAALISIVLVQLALNVALAWYVVDLQRNSPPSPSELVARMMDLEQEFVAMADSQARFLKKISKRDLDESKRLSREGPAGYEAPALRPKEQLRQQLAQLRRVSQNETGTRG